MFKIYKKFFVPANVKMSVVGNISDDMNDTKNLVSGIFENKTKGKNAYKSVPRSKIKKRYIWHKEDRDQYSLSFVWAIPGQESLSLRKKIALGVARYILGGSARSRLFKNLRLKNSLVYQTGAFITFYPGDGEFEVWSATNKNKVYKVRKEMSKVVSEFIFYPIPETELKRAIEYLNTQTLLGYDSIDGISSIITDSLFEYGRAIPPEEYINIANSLTEVEIRDQAKKYLDSRPHITIMSREDPKLA